MNGVWCDVPLRSPRHSSARDMLAWPSLWFLEERELILKVALTFTPWCTRAEPQGWLSVCHSPLSPSSLRFSNACWSFTVSDSSVTASFFSLEKNFLVGSIFWQCILCGNNVDKFPEIHRREDRLFTFSPLAERLEFGAFSGLTKERRKRRGNGRKLRGTAHAQSCVPIGSMWASAAQISLRMCCTPVHENVARPFPLLFPPSLGLTHGCINRPGSVLLFFFFGFSCSMPIHAIYLHSWEFTFFKFHKIWILYDYAGLKLET